MVSREALHQTGRRVIVRPLVVLAAKCLGPGRLRLKMVKLAHDLGGGDNFFEVFYGSGRVEPRPAFEGREVQSPTQRAA
jgi:hypothetical protein